MVFFRVCHFKHEKAAAIHRNRLLQKKSLCHSQTPHPCLPSFFPRNGFSWCITVYLQMYLGSVYVLWVLRVPELYDTHLKCLHSFGWNASSLNVCSGGEQFVCIWDVFLKVMSRNQQTMNLSLWYSIHLFPHLYVDTKQFVYSLELPKQGYAEFKNSVNMFSQ